MTLEQPGWTRKVLLDGGAGSRWSQRGWALCTEQDVSLTHDARSRTVTRHVAGTSVVVGEDPFAVLRGEIEEAARRGADDLDWYGWFGHAARVDLAGVPGSLVPEAVWMRPSRFEPAPDPVPAAPPGPTGTVPQVPDWYRTAFAEVQERLHAGDTYEVNLTTRFRATLEVGPATDPAAVHERLRATNPAPLSGLVVHDVPGHRGWLLSSSPEQYLRVVDGHLSTRPIKGTTPRGVSPEEDRRHAEQLRTDPKILAENLMITDLLRNDVAQVSVPGTVQVPELMVVESHPSVHQLVTAVTGTLAPGLSPLDAVHALFPPGSMTGAPKRRTMEIIDRVEETPRGVYAGAYGRIGSREADLAVVIRSLVTDGDGHWEWGSGGGITVDSTPEAEWAELCWKAERVAAALLEG